MDLRQLEMFLALVECGGYTRAGEKLHVAHSAIHRQMRILEFELGQPLVTRAGKRIQLTEAGSVVVNLARQVHRDISMAQQQINELAQLRSGLVRIGTGPTLLSYFLIQILEIFRKRFPGIEVYVMTDTHRGHILEALDRNQLNLGILLTYPDQPQFSTSFQCIPIYRDEIVMGVSKRHPLATKRSISLGKMREFPFILPSKNGFLRGVIDKAFENSGVVPKILMELDNQEAMVRMIEVESGIAFLCKFRAVTDKIHFFSFPGQPIYVDVVIVYPKTEFLPRAITEFIRICQEEGNYIKFQVAASRKAASGNLKAKTYPLREVEPEKSSARVANG